MWWEVNGHLFFSQFAAFFRKNEKLDFFRKRVFSESTNGLDVKLCMQ